MISDPVEGEMGPQVLDISNLIGQYQHRSRCHRFRCTWSTSIDLCHSYREQLDPVCEMKRDTQNEHVLNYAY